MAAAFLLIGASACNRNSSGGDVMASVNGRKIYRSEVDKYYANQTAGSDQQPAGEQAVSLRLSILNELIETEILMQRAEKLGLLATDEEVDRKLNEIKSPYTAEEFNKRLQDKKISVDDFKRDLRRSLTRDKVLNKEITSRINITDQDVSSYYNEHKAEFNLIEAQYHLAKIMVSGMANAQVHNLQNSKAQNDAEARKKIQMIANRLDSGDDFATLAMNYSEDPETSNNGGDLGMAPESALRRTPIRQRAKRGDETQAGAIHAGDSHGQSSQSSARRLHDREADCEGTGGPEGLERSAGAAGHPPAIARPAGAVIESGVLREPARRRQSHELLCGRSTEGCGSGEVGQPVGP